MFETVQTIINAGGYNLTDLSQVSRPCMRWANSPRRK
jgi:hypothetical protein